MEVMAVEEEQEDIGEDLVMQEKEVEVEVLVVEEIQETLEELEAEDPEELEETVEMDVMVVILRQPLVEEVIQEEVLSYLQLQQDLAIFNQQLLKIQVREQTAQNTREEVVVEVGVPLSYQLFRAKPIHILQDKEELAQ